MPKQVDFARTIHGAGTDLLNLISDILDLSKIESEPLRSMRRSAAEQPDRSDGAAVPPRGGQSPARLRRRNRSNLGRHHHDRLEALAAGAQATLLSNAFKFTETGSVRLKVSAAVGGWSADHTLLKSIRRGGVRGVG